MYLRGEDMAIIGSLGTVIFEVSNNSLFSGKGLGVIGSLLNKTAKNTGITYRTPQNFQRTSKARWATHDIIGQKPVSEFIGAGLETFSFDMHLDSDLGTNPEKELDKLRKMRDTGEKVFLLLGGKPVLENNSRVYITDLNETVLRTDNRGKILSLDVSVNLQEYVMRMEELAQNENNTSESGDTIES